MFNRFFILLFFLLIAFLNQISFKFVPCEKHQLSKSIIFSRSISILLEYLFNKKYLFEEVSFSSRGNVASSSMFSKIFIDENSLITIELSFLFFNSLAQSFRLSLEKLHSASPGMRSSVFRC